MQGVTRNPLADPGHPRRERRRRPRVVARHLRLRRRRTPPATSGSPSSARRSPRSSSTPSRRSAARAPPRSSWRSPGPPSPRFFGAITTAPAADRPAGLRPVPLLAGRQPERPRPRRSSPRCCRSSSSAGCSPSACGRSLNTLALGDDVARGLGARVGLIRIGTAVAVVLLCGSATAAAGPVGFVGLTIPHVARALVGTDYRRILPTSMLLGPGPAARRRRRRPRDRPARPRSRSPSSPP